MCYHRLRKCTFQELKEAEQKRQEDERRQKPGAHNQEEDVRRMDDGEADDKMQEGQKTGEEDEDMEEDSKEVLKEEDNSEEESNNSKEVKGRQEVLHRNGCGSCGSFAQSVSIPASVVVWTTMQTEVNRAIHTTCYLSSSASWRKAFYANSTQTNVTFNRLDKFDRCQVFMGRLDNIIFQAFCH